MTTEDTDSPAARRERYHEADVVVVGAGVFGCAIAHALADQGRSVILLERWMHEPNRIVGELLQPGGVAALRKLGLEHCIEGIDAYPCYGYHVMYHGEDVVIPYPAVDAGGRVSVHPLARRGAGAAEFVASTQSNNNTKTDKKTDERGEEKKKVWGAQGCGFHHGRFIMQLRRACLAHPNISVFETEVTATIRGTTGKGRDTKSNGGRGGEVLGVATRTAAPDGGEKTPDCFFGQLTVIADGYASKFREEVLGRAAVTKSRFYALELKDCPFAPQGFGHVVIGSAFPVLLYQIGARETRVLIDVPDRLPAASPANGGVRGYIEKVVVPSLPEHLRPYFAAALADGKIPRSMPNSWLPPARQGKVSGVAVLGDAYNMRHPLTGGGMTVALSDCVLLAELLDPRRVPSLGDFPLVRRALDAFHWRRKSLTSIINVLALALYSLFAAADDAQLRALQRGCFAYFRRGHAAEPVALMAGLIPRPLVLAWHFYSVAFLAVWLHAVNDVCGGSVLGVWKAPLAVVDAVRILWKACVVFLPVLWAELQ